MKKFTSIVLSAMMILSIFTTLGITVSAEDSSGEYYEDYTEYETYPDTYPPAYNDWTIEPTEYQPTYQETYISTVESIGEYIEKTATTDLTAEPDESGKIGENVWYNFYNDGTLVLGGTGSIYDYLYYSSPFKGRTDITNVIIQNDITNICAFTFENCTNLRNITVNEENTLYSSLNGNLYNKKQTELIQYAIGKIDTSFVIPYSVTHISAWAFEYCTSLTSVIIPDSVTSIGGGAFANCENLTNVTIGNSVTSIDSYVFDNCTNLTNITIPNSVISIGSSAFEDCKNLTEIIIPNKVTTIEDSAFSSCINITDVYIPDSVTVFGRCVFENCTNLENVRIGKNITSLEGTFKNCTKLKSVEIPEGVTSIGKEVVTYVAPNYSGTFEGCTSLESIIIPESIEIIGINAFKDCINLKNITIPISVQSIGDRAFNGCTNIVRITIPDSVRYLGTATFENCANLERVILPQNIIYIRSKLFYNCTNLENVNIPYGAQTIDDLAFGNCKCKVIIPSTVNSISGLSNRLTILCYNNSFALQEAQKKNIKYEIIDFRYIELDYKTVKVTGYEGDSPEVEIPQKILGYDVSCIGSGAFQNTNDIDRIIVYDNITAIEENAFNINSDITLLGFYDSIAQKYAYQYSLKFRAFETLSYEYNFIDDSNIEITSYSGFDTDLVIPEDIDGYTVKAIKENAFTNCENLSTINFPNTVTKYPDNYNIIIFNLNNGSGDILRKIKAPDYGTELTASISAFDNYFFMGWSTTLDGNIIYNSNDIYSENKNITLYAVWGEKCLSCNSGTIYKTCNVCDGTKYTIKHNQTCNTCNGIGKVEKLKHRVCSKCNGVGYYYNVIQKKLLICPTCKNGGRISGVPELEGKSIEFYKETSTCSTCNGIGKLDGKVTCDTCNGIGQISVKCNNCNGLGSIPVHINNIEPTSTSTEPTSAIIDPTESTEPTLDSTNPSTSTTDSTQTTESTETTHPSTSGEWVVVKTPTCDEVGIEVNYSTQKSREIPALGHTTKTIGSKSATYFAKGYTGDKVCTVCGKTVSKGKTIAKLKLSTPKVKITAGKKKLTVKYTKVKNATGFQVKYTYKGKTKTKTYSTKKSVSKVIKKLKKGTYKVKVRALIKTAYSSWTKAKKVKVK